VSTRSHRHSTSHLLSDIGLILLSILVSVFVVRTELVPLLLDSTEKVILLGSFIAGMFFTSAFTTAPAIATLGQLSLEQTPLITALIGAAGAVAGDLLIFRFVKDRFSADVMELIEERRIVRRFAKLFKLRFFRWFTFFLGGLVLASPLPDEFGIALLGFTRVNVWHFVVISYVFNFIGIYLIGLAAHALAA